MPAPPAKLSEFSPNAFTKQISPSFIQIDFRKVILQKDSPIKVNDKGSKIQLVKLIKATPKIFIISYWKFKHSFK